jgi:hypothetical protein
MKPSIAGFVMSHVITMRSRSSIDNRGRYRSYRVISLFRSTFVGVRFGREAEEDPSPRAPAMTTGQMSWAHEKPDQSSIRGVPYVSVGVGNVLLVLYANFHDLVFSGSTLVPHTRKSSLREESSRIDRKITPRDGHARQAIHSHGSYWNSTSQLCCVRNNQMVSGTCSHWNYLQTR